MAILGAKANQDNVLNLWTYNIPASPHHCISNQSVFADTASFQEISVTVEYWYLWAREL